MSNITPRTRKRRGPGRPAQSENRDTRGDILRASEKLFAQTGFEATSLRQIATEAGVDLATVKYHFPEKAALYDETYELGHARFIERFSPLLVELVAAESKELLQSSLQRISKLCSSFIREDRSFVRLMLFRLLEGAEANARADVLQEELLELLSNGMQRAVQLKLVKDVDVRALVTFIVVGLPMWVISAEVRPQLLGMENASEDLWNDRMDTFITSLLNNVVLTNVQT